MPIKWNEPPGPPPSWLDLADEVTPETDTKPLAWKTMSKKELMPVFVISCWKALRNLGLSHEQAIEVLSNSVVETGWGKSFMAWNLGGWKIRKTDVEEAKKNKRKAKWWRASGNKSSGDPPWCFYRAFDSLEEFFAEWLLRFVPKPGTVSKSHRYYKTGELFWSGGNTWFLELCKAGYKGSITARNPGPSVHSHKSIVSRSMAFLCQYALGVEVDGNWGPKSTAACKGKQRELGLTETGKPELSLLEMMFSGNTLKERA